MTSDPEAIRLLRSRVDLGAFEWELPTLDDDHWDVAITYHGPDADDSTRSTDYLATLTHGTEDLDLDFTLDRSPYTDVPVLYVTCR